MSNSTVNLVYESYGKHGRDVILPVDGGSHIYEGTLVSQLVATGMLVPGSTAASGPAIGVATHEVDNSGGADGAKRCKIEFDRTFAFPNATAGDACSEAMLFGTVVYMTDDHTIANNSNLGARQVAGRFMGMTDDGLVRVFVGPLSGITTVEASMATIPLSLYAFREVSSAGDVGAIAAIGGVLASDTTPIMLGNAAETAEIQWASSNSDPISTQVALPADFDGTKPVYIECDGYGGTTNAFSLTVETGWDGGALVSDTAVGSASATVHTATATVAAADIPDTARRLTLAITPAAHTTDAMGLVNVRIKYSRRPVVV